MVDLSPDETDPQDLSNRIFNTISRPIEHSSLFYILLYADDILGVDNAEFDLERVTQDAYRGFIAYAAYTVTREAANFPFRYDIDGSGVNELIERGDESVVRAHVVQRAPPELVDPIMNFAKNGQFIARGLSPRAQQSDVTGFFRRLNERTRFDSNPDLFFQVVESLMTDFGAMRTGDADTGWFPDFNGQSWAGVVKHLQRSDEFPRVAWVDQAWGIEHNTGNWLSKIQFSRDEKTRLTQSDNEFFVGGRTPSGIREGEVQNILLRVLNANRRGDMASVLAVALDFNDRVAFNLPRLRPILRTRTLDIFAIRLSLPPDPDDQRQIAILNGEGGLIGEILDNGEGTILDFEIKRQEVPDQQRDEVVDRALEIWESNQRPGRDEVVIAPIGVPDVVQEVALERGYRQTGEPPFVLLKQFGVDPGPVEDAEIL